MRLLFNLSRLAMGRIFIYAIMHRCEFIGSLKDQLKVEHKEETGKEILIPPVRLTDMLVHCYIVLTRLGHFENENEKLYENEKPYVENENEKLSLLC